MAHSRKACVCLIPESKYKHNIVEEVICVCTGEDFIFEIMS